jgi:hypothetical protein
MHIEFQRTKNNQKIIELEEQSWSITTSGFQNLL